MAKSAEPLLDVTGDHWISVTVLQHLWVIASNMRLTIRLSWRLQPWPAVNWMAIHQRGLFPPHQLRCYPPTLHSEIWLHAASLSFPPPYSLFCQIAETHESDSPQFLCNPVICSVSDFVSFWFYTKASVLSSMTMISYYRSLLSCFFKLTFREAVFKPKNSRPLWSLGFV